MNKEKPDDALEDQRNLELRIRSLLEENASTKELQKAYDEFHSHILAHGIRGASPRGYLYKDGLSIIDRLFLAKTGEGSSVLEIGVGDGHFLIACAKKGNLVKGIDISSIVIDRLKVAIDREGINAELDLGDARSLRYPSRVFDYVVGKDLIEHIPEADLQAHLQEVWRALKPNGYYLIWTPSKLLGHTSLGTHLREYTLGEVLQELQKVRFVPYIVILPFYAISKIAKSVPQSHTITSFLLGYERILQRIFRLLEIQVQNPIIYLIVPPICIAARKYDRENYGAYDREGALVQL